MLAVLPYLLLIQYVASGLLPASIGMCLPVAVTAGYEFVPLSNKRTLDIR